MIQKWIVKENNNELIICFLGWGLTEQAILHLDTNKKDLLVCYDYQDFDFQSELSSYTNIILVGYSMGILAANHILEKLQFCPSLKIAIHGSGIPASDTFGIPMNIYTGTLNSLNERNFIKFCQRICGDKDTFAFLKNTLPATDVSKLQDALNFMLNTQTMEKTIQKWSVAWISETDLIFPINNLINYWEQNNTPTLRTTYAHFPFLNWKSWDEIINISLQCLTQTKN